MISAQCDELRDLALWLDDEFYDAEASKVLDASDTILQLRDDLQRANTENAKLRELVCDIWTYATEPVSKRNNLKERLARLDDIGDRMRELVVEVDE